MALDNLVKSMYAKGSSLVKGFTLGSLLPFAPLSVMSKALKRGVQNTSEVIGFESSILTTLPYLISKSIEYPSIETIMATGAIVSTLYEIGDPFSIPQKIKNIFDNSVKVLTENPKKSLKSFAKPFLVYPLAYTLAVGMAASHFVATLKTPSYDPSLVNVQAESWYIQDKSNERAALVIGEMHIYNYSSQTFVRNLIKNSDVDVMLLEGPSEDISVSIPEMVTILSLAAGAQAVYAPPRADVPEFHLEMIDSSSEFYEGVDTETVSYVRGGLKAASLFGPGLYFMGLPLRTHSLDSFKELLGVNENHIGLLEKRNELMSSSISHYLREHPNHQVLIIVGKNHVDGIKENLRKIYPLESIPILPPEFADSKI